MNTGDSTPEGNNMARLLSEPMPADPVKTLPLEGEAREILKRHGCMFYDCQEHCIMTYPKSTTKQEIYPRMVITTRYMVAFPDGYEIMEMYDWPRKISLLFYRPEPS